MEELVGREAVESGDFEPAIELKDLVVSYGRRRGHRRSESYGPKGICLRFPRSKRLG